jgi:hypothetical protein
LACDELRPVRPASPFRTVAPQKAQVSLPDLLLDKHDEEEPTGTAGREHTSAYFCKLKSSSIEEAEKTERQQAEAKAAARIVLTQTVHAAAAALNVADQLLKAIAKALCGSKSTTEEASSSGHSLAGRVKL